jgi:hypothetical protein
LVIASTVPVGGKVNRPIDATHKCHCHLPESVLLRA